jgi:hypothetical protein
MQVTLQQNETEGRFEGEAGRQMRRQHWIRGVTQHVHYIRQLILDGEARGNIEDHGL